MTRLPREFWAPEPLDPIQLLADLRLFVLERSHRRLPRWHFRVAPDLILRIQPKPAERRDSFWLFAGEAFEGDGLTREACASRAGRTGLSVWRLTFGVVASEPAGWSVRPTYCHWPSQSCGPATAWALRARVMTVLRSDCFDVLRADMMLSPACLACGKALTDPVSIARWIGPECAGTSGLDARRFDVRSSEVAV